MAVDTSPTANPYQSPAHTGLNSEVSIEKPGNAAPNIIDIRKSRAEISLVEEINKGLNAPAGTEKTLPTLLLYDEAGLKLFEEITYLDEYYLTNAEIDVLQKHAESLAAMVKPGSVLLELGSGNLRKISIILQALEKQGKPVEYYALDCSLSELERTLRAAPIGSFRHVKCHGLFGTYDDGLEWLQLPTNRSKPKVVLSMGSSIGNFDRNDAAVWVKQFIDLLDINDRMLIGIDGCKDPVRVHDAYNDSQDVTHKFTANGLVHANRLLGRKAFDLNIWKADGEYDQQRGCHRAYVIPSADVTVLGSTVQAGEKVRIEESYKFDAGDLELLWHEAGVTEVMQCSVENEQYAMHLIAKKPYALPWSPNQYAATPVPTLEEWDALWNLWDTVSRRMLPDEELIHKPIKLRNACIFYLGHIPTFLDIKLAATTNGIHTEPSFFPDIFERGIDPDVDNPEQCHAHSEIPDDWPELSVILGHQQRVRERVRSLYADGSAEENRLVARCLWLGYEHEAMHLETLLYMLVQSDKTLPPPGTAVPNFDVLEEQAQKSAVPNEWFTIPEQEITLNMDDPETETGPRRFFGWDIEKPSRRVNVPSFKVQARPITNQEFAEYLINQQIDAVPASWIDIGRANNGHARTESGTNLALHTFIDGKAVRTVYGPVALANALSWPVSASFDELKGCAAYMGGRIPTLEEARSLYAFVDSNRTRGQEVAEQANAKMIPAVNDQLVNDGVEESPPSNSKLDLGRGDPDPHDLFCDLKAKNVGFQKWTPISVVDKGNKLQGQAGMGGLWEWTSSPLRKHAGFEPMRLYEAYSQDFFDEKHNIVLGGSWATVPRIAGRKTFVNWYQRNYPFVWAGARLVRDL